MVQEKTIHLTTEELGLLADGQTLTFVVDEEAIRLSAKDLSISLGQLVEGEVARAGGLVLRYD